MPPPEKKPLQPAPTTQPKPPVNEAAPPQPAPGPTPGEGKKPAPPTAAPPVSGDQGKDLSETPVTTAAKKPDPNLVASATGPTAGSPIRPTLTLPEYKLDWLAMRRPFLD